MSLNILWFSFLYFCLSLFIYNYLFVYSLIIQGKLFFKDFCFPKTDFLSIVCMNLSFFLLFFVILLSSSIGLCSRSIFCVLVLLSLSFIKKIVLLYLLLYCVFILLFPFVWLIDSPCFTDHILPSNFDYFLLSILVCLDHSFYQY